MKIKFGAIVTDGRNKIGGHVASKNRAGSYLRTKVSPTNPHTSFQTKSRNRLATVSSAWRGLSVAQIKAWNSAVDNFKTTDVFGDLRRPTGFNLFQRLNNPMKLAEFAILLDPPAPQPADFIGIGTLSAYQSGSISIQFSEIPVLAAGVILLSATPAMSKGISVAKSKFRYLGFLPGQAGGNSAFASKYIAKYGQIGTAGQKIFVEIKTLNLSTGQMGVPVVLSAIIV